MRSLTVCRTIAVGFVLMLAALTNVPVASAQFLEDFGHAGTIRVFKGQVRDSLDQPVAYAAVEVQNVATRKEYSLETDYRGAFRKNNLPPGKYLVTVRGLGFNVGQYTVTISSKSSSASNSYTVVRLSPGCASGNSGVAFVSKLTHRSFKP